MSNNFSIKNQRIFKKITLDEGQPGKTYRILRCELPLFLKIRFSEMGLTPHTIVSVQKKAPLGDPLEIRARGYSLCIRAKDAKCFFVEEVDF